MEGNCRVVAVSESSYCDLSGLLNHYRGLLKSPLQSRASPTHKVPYCSNKLKCLALIALKVESNLARPRLFITLTHTALKIDN